MLTDSVQDVRYTWYHYGLRRCPLMRTRIASGKSVTIVVAVYLNRANGHHISYYFPCGRHARVTLMLGDNIMYCTGIVLQLMSS